MVPLYWLTMASQLAVLYVLYVLAVVLVPVMCLATVEGVAHELLPNPTSSSRMLWCRGVIVSTPQ